MKQFFIPFSFMILLAWTISLSLRPDKPQIALATQYVFIATEDSFINNGGLNTNYGALTTLQADNAPNIKRILLRFQVQGLPAGSVISSANLRLFVKNYSANAGTIYRVNGGWGERTVTWSNQPIIGSSISDLSRPAIVDTWRQADITSAIQGNGEANFYIITASSDAVYYSSRETTNQPTLIIQAIASSPTDTVRPSNTPTETLPTNTPTEIPTATTSTPISGFQPVPPISGAFFYPWFPSAWTQSGIFPYTNYSPSLGFYDSQNDSIIDQQLVLASQAHLEAFISSWWGQGHHTDLAFQHILARSERNGSPYQNMRWAIYYEQEGQSDPTVSQIVSDLQYLEINVFSHPGYLRVNGRPVVFVFAGGADGAGMASRWAQAKALYGGSVYVVLKVYVGYRTDPNQPDSWHQYGPAVAYDSQLPYSVAVSPGFWKVGESPRLIRDPTRFELDVQHMAISGAFWQLVTTWNEWGEGTSVEPAAEFNNVYIDILCRNLPGTVSCPLLGPTPTTFPTPTSTLTPTMGPTRTTIPTATVTPTLIFTPTSVSIPTPTITPTFVSEDPVLVGAGDIASCSSSGDEATANLLDSISGTVFTAGDNVYESGTASEFANCYDPSWGRHKARTKPSAGNHDYNTTGATGYYGYFGTAAGDPSKGYYSYDLGTWHIIVINSNCGEVGGCQAGSAQETWLRSDLIAHSSSVCTLAYWHHPRFSSGDTHGSDTELQPIWQALYDARADVVLSGHEHNYERFAPQSPSGVADSVRGIREFVVGTGGRSHYGFGVPIANSEVRNGTTFGVFKLILHSSSYDWQFIPIAGQTFTDSGSQSCVPQIAALSDPLGLARLEYCYGRCLVF